MGSHVLISGGGIAGLTLALKLLQQGLAVTLAEKEGKPSVKYKGELLQPKSLELLDGLGLLAEVRQKGYPLYTTAIIEELPHRKETIVFRYDLLQSSYNYALMIPHEALKGIILAQAQKYAGFRYLQPAKFLSFGETGPRKRTAVIGMKDGAELRLEADFFVGAEGRQSPVRTNLGIGLRTASYNHHFLTVSFPRPPSLTEAEMLVRGHYFLGLFPLPEERVRTVFLIKPKEYKQLRKQGLQAVYKQYCSFYPELDGYVQSIGSWKDIQLMIPVRHNAKQYVKGNCIIIGDAAHSVHPMAGEGMNLAIQDAYTLGELLGWMYGQDKLDPEHLQWFERVRKPRAEYVSRLSHQSALAYSYSLPPWSWFRARVLKRMEQSEAMHTKQMLNISGLGIWKETWLDRFVQAGLLPMSLLGSPEQQQHFFTPERDYPWKHDRKKGGMS
ncbi:FAD-dependent monooxygenase [Ectobacillus ponti]|uniref:FAD-dependent monooxygenase n=1 Tax=Ectobacillus ponti TaxID=2961894 RepID=A0AA41X7C4_9BACI|nr:FAD-dependent monooxygenase [Ectobacillus ponti]